MFSPSSSIDASHTLTTRALVRRRVAIGVAIAAALVGAPFVAQAEPLANQTPPILADDDSARAAAPAASDDRLLDSCPIGGSSTFEDSWGWARSGGRRHEGVDIIAERGTPVIAVRDGWAQFKNSNLGGRSIWLTTPDGDRFFYAHLDAWEGDSRDVRAGDVIGYVGSSGNAGGPHLHFETQPDGHVENPFPHTLQACVPPLEDLLREMADRDQSESNVIDDADDL